MITLSTTEITSWNTNTISTTPDTQGFEIRDSSGNRIEGIHDQNQFFTGRGEVSEVFNLISPDRTQTGTIGIDNSGNITISNGTNQFRLLAGDDTGVDTTSGGFGINTSLDN